MLTMCIAVFYWVGMIDLYRYGTFDWNDNYGYVAPILIDAKSGSVSPSFTINIIGIFRYCDLTTIAQCWITR